MMELEPRRSWLRTLAIFAAVACVACPVLYEIAIAVVPAQTPDGHGLMPIGQLAFAMLNAPIIGAIVAKRYGRRA